MQTRHLSFSIYAMHTCSTCNGYVLALQKQHVCKVLPALNTSWCIQYFMQWLILKDWHSQTQTVIFYSLFCVSAAAAIELFYYIFHCCLLYCHLRILLFSGCTLFLYISFGELSQSLLVKLEKRQSENHELFSSC